MNCNTNPFIEHGFDRNASHSSDRYVCTCEYKNKESLEQDLLYIISYIQHNINCGRYISNEDLANLINITSALKWENENAQSR